MGFLGDTSLLSKRAEALTALLDGRTHAGSRLTTALAVIGAPGLCTLIWVPVNPEASCRSWWLPWPAWSASALHATDISVRDYEIDGHRLQPHEHERLSTSVNREKT